MTSAMTVVIETLRMRRGESDMISPSVAFGGRFHRTCAKVPDERLSQTCFLSRQGQLQG
jgi:hypothetical protein